MSYRALGAVMAATLLLSSCQVIMLPQPIAPKPRPVIVTKDESMAELNQYVSNIVQQKQKLVTGLATNQIMLFGLTLGFHV